jgi:hypothetical protein
MDRRRSLQVLGALAAAPVLARLNGLSAAQFDAIVSQAHDERTSRRTLTPEQHRQVEVVAEYLIPRTDTPGATDARVADFVDHMLANWYPPAERDRFVVGLQELDVRARRRRNVAFNQLAAVDQLDIVDGLDREVAALRRSNASAANEHWFGMLKFLTVWGYHTSRVVAEREERMIGRYDGNAPYTAARPS